MQSYTDNEQFPAKLVPYSTQQGIAVSDDAGAHLAHTAPGSPPAFEPVRQAGPALTFTNADQMQVNEPDRSGEVAAGGTGDTGYADNVWQPAPDGRPGDGWTTAPPAPQDVNATWVQRP